MGQRKQGTEPEQRPAAPGFFATTLPGLGILLRQEIDANPDLEAVNDLGNDGRADIVFFRMRRGARPDLADLRLAEDVFVTLAEAGSGPPHRVAQSLVTRTGLGAQPVGVDQIRAAPELLNELPGDRSRSR